MDTTTEELDDALPAQPEMVMELSTVDTSGIDTSETNWARLHETVTDVVGGLVGDKVGEGVFVGNR